MLPGSSIPKTFTTRQSSENDKTPSWSLSKRRNTSLRSVTCSSDNWSWSWNLKKVCHLLFILGAFKITKSTLIISSILSGFPFLPLIFLIDLEEFLTWKYLADILIKVLTWKVFMTTKLVNTKFIPKITQECFIFKAWLIKKAE